MLHTFANFWCSRSLSFIYSGEGIVTCRGGFNFVFPWLLVVLSTFSCIYLRFTYLFVRGCSRLYPFFSFLWLHLVVCGILVPTPRIEPMLPASRARSLNHWSATEIPLCPVLIRLFLDRGAWWAAIYRVTQSRTQLKRLSKQQLYY